MRTNFKNFARTNITAPDSSITTLVWDVVLSELFPTTNAYATIEQEVSGVKIKEEVVLITTRTSESFIVVRWSDGTAPQDFTVWGGTIYLSMNAVAGQFTDIRDEVESNDTDITTLQTSKLDIAWGLRTWLTATTLMTTNGSGAETQLAFSWVDTEVLYGDGTRWEIISWLNYATVSQLINKDTWDEYIRLTDFNNYYHPLPISWTSVIVLENLSRVTTTIPSSSWAVLKTFTIWVWWSYTLEWVHWIYRSWSDRCTRTRVAINWVQLWSYYSLCLAWDWPEKTIQRSVNITVSNWDVVTIQWNEWNADWVSDYCFVENTYLKCDITFPVWDLLWWTTA